MNYGRPIIYVIAGLHKCTHPVSHSNEVMRLYTTECLTTDRIFMTPEQVMTFGPLACTSAPVTVTQSFAALRCSSPETINYVMYNVLMMSSRQSVGNQGATI